MCWVISGHGVHAATSKETNAHGRPDTEATCDFQHTLVEPPGDVPVSLEQRLARTNVESQVWLPDQKRTCTDGKLDSGSEVRDKDALREGALPHLFLEGALAHTTKQPRQGRAPAFFPPQ